MSMPSRARASRAPTTGVSYGGDASKMTPRGIPAGEPGDYSDDDSQPSPRSPTGEGSGPPRPHLRPEKGAAFITSQGADTRFIVTNLPGTPSTLYEKVYCARGQAENLIKAHKLHLACDRTSCRKATANQFRLLFHTAAYWLLLTLRSLAPRTSFWRDAQFDTIRLCLLKVAARVTEMVTRIKIALPSAFPY